MGNLVLWYWANHKIYIIVYHVIPEFDYFRILPMTKSTN